MGKRCVTGGYSNTNSDGVSVNKLPKDEVLCEKWDRFVRHSRPGKAGGQHASVIAKSSSITKTLLSGKWDSPGNWI